MTAKIKLVGRERLLNRIIDNISKTIDLSGHYEQEQLLRSLVENTPIDTGYARSRWAVGEYTQNKTTVKVDATISGLIKDFKFTVVNDAPYILYLNRGHSKQAPPFFIEKTILSRGYKINSFMIRS